MASRNDIEARLRKIAALAAAGTGGEQTNAAALLERLAKEHGIDLSTLDDTETRTPHYQKMSGPQWEWRLFCQVFWRLDSRINCWRTHTKFASARYDAIKVECTDAEFLECVAKYEIYKRDYKRQLSLFYHAFLIRNDLLADPDPDDPHRHKPSEDEARELLAAVNLANGMYVSEIHRQIEQKEEAPCER